MGEVGKLDVVPAIALLAGCIALLTGFQAVGAANSVAGASSAAAESQSPVSESSKPEKLHKDSIVVDMHADGLFQLTRPEGAVKVDALQAGPARFRRGGVDAQFFAIWIPPKTKDVREAVQAQLAAFREQIIGKGRVVRQARTTADIRAAAAAGRVAALLGVEGATALDGDVNALTRLAKVGVRYISLTWNETNDFGQGNGCTGRAGATAKGKALVRLANELHVMPDVSHTSAATFWDVVNESGRPVIASHSNSNAVFPHPRNLDDWQLWAIAESGGFVAVNFFSGFLAEGGSGATAGGGDKGATIDDLLKHLRHVRAVAGTGHVGIGSDFDGVRHPVAGLEDSSRMMNLTAALVRDGWTDEEIRGVLGENVLRVMDETDSGAFARRVDHRPAEIVSITADVSAHSAAAVADGNTSTAWEPLEDGRARPASIRLEAAGTGVDRVAICASSPEITSGGFVASVRGLCGGVEVGGPVEISIGPLVRPYRVDVPGLSACDRPGVEISFGEEVRPEIRPRISEIALERAVLTESH